MDPIVGCLKEEADAQEAQAIGRAHRQGQARKLQVVRLIMRDTLEHELLLRQALPRARWRPQGALVKLHAVARFIGAGRGQPHLNKRAPSYGELLERTRKRLKQ